MSIKKKKLLLILLFLFVKQVKAQNENKDSEHIKAMSKEFLNPLSDIWSLQIQNDFVFLGGDAISGNRKANYTNIQPIMPIPLGDKWNLINRPLIPYVILETPQQNGSYKNERGLGDIELIQVISPSKGLVFFNLIGGGVTWIFPTATNAVIGSEQWSVGPTFGMGRVDDHVMFGFIAQQNWSLGGQKNSIDINRFKFQYFLKYRLSSTFNIGISPIIVANWDRDSSNRWSIPIGFGFGSTTKIGRLPVNLSYEIHHYEKSPEFIGAQWNFRFTLTTGIMNPLKQELNN